ncbi:MAG: DUF2723 domain-containing protein [Gemmatimonadota bacterium]|nr:DUF2723 domain-containing protein [Gemmatimonadota bacterium]
MSRAEPRGGPEVGDPAAVKPPYRDALIAGAAVFALYVATLAPTTAWWDASEYIATAHILGIPHPPGNPLFVALARAWSMLLAPLGIAPAVRINLFAAATSAGSFAFFYLVAHRILAGAGIRGVAGRIGSAVSVCLGATTYTVWTQSNANEKVYTLSVLIIAAVSWLAVRWRDRAQEPGSERLLLWAAYLMVLGSTSHLMSVLPIAALAVLVLMTRWTTVANPAFLGRLALVGILGLSFSFFLPIRAAERPVVNEGDPVCESLGGAAVAIYTAGKRGCPALAESLRREQYQKPPLSVRMAPLRHQVLNYFQYLDWQWARGLHTDEVPGSARTPVTLVFLLLAALGLGVALRGDRPVGIYLAILLGVLSLGLVFYLNFRFGYSLAPEITDRSAHEVRERDYFFVASFAVWGLLAGIGLTWCWQALARRGGDWRLASPVLLLALVPLATNWQWASRAGDYAARDWAYDVLMSVEPYGVLFTNGDNDTFPLWYLQEVEGIRRDVTVAVVQYLYTDWYAGQLMELTHPDRQRPYEPVVPGLYDERPPPAGAVLSLRADQVAQIVDGQVPPGFSVQFGNVSVEFPEGMFLGRGHYLTLAMIAASGHERPIYFAGTGGEMQNVGLSPWGVNQGLVTKLVMRDLDADPPQGFVRTVVPGIEWVDLPRSQRLVAEVYTYRGLRQRDIWPDNATLNIPAQYYFMGGALAEAAAAVGDTVAARRYADMRDEFLSVAQGGRKAARSY